MERDYWMSAEEAVKYGLVDGIIEKAYNPMADQDQQHRFTLPDGARICVMEIGPEHAASTMEVMESGWQTAYVDHELMTTRQARRWVDTSNDGLIERLQDRMGEAQERGRAGDPTAPRYFGAFVLGQSEELLKQVGMVKYVTAEEGYPRSGPFAAAVAEGEISEIDVTEDWLGRGVGTAMVYVAM